MPDPSDPGASVTVARRAMGTRFEILLHGADPVHLHAAGEDALHEIERAEAQLSFYSPHSELSRLNARAASEAVQVEPGLFRLLQFAQRMHRESNGAFDVTVAPLMQAWGFTRGAGQPPDPHTLNQARQSVGMHLLLLDESRFTVQFQHPRMRLDLGALGKGYAIDIAAEVLRDAGIASALLHGGTSTVHALGRPPDQPAWKVAVEFQPSPANPSLTAPQPARLLAVVPLLDASLSVSAVWGKAFQSENKTMGHVIDPRTGQPADRAMLAAVVSESAMTSDACSTALLILGAPGLRTWPQRGGPLRSLVAGQDPISGRIWAEARGVTLEDGLESSGENDRTC